METVEKKNTEITEEVKPTPEKEIENPNFVPFKKPLTFEGKKYDGLDMDLDSLTGADIETAEVQFVSEDPSNAAQTPLKEMSKGFQAILAAKAAKVNVALIRSLSASDYAKVTTKVQVFLLTQD